DLRLTLAPVFSELLERLLQPSARSISSEVLTVLLSTLSALLKYLLVPSTDSTLPSVTLLPGVVFARKVNSDASYTLTSNISRSLVAFADKNIGYTPSTLEEAVDLFPHSARIINVLRCLVTRPVAEWAKHADITQAEVCDSSIS
ncbi:hypothetical protein F5876DRAFT_83977, partial [Lentinula aff. lateritia]